MTTKQKLQLMKQIIEKNQQHISDFLNRRKK